MALIQDLEKMCEFLCVSSPFKKNSNLKDFKQQVIAIEKDLLHEVISTLPTTSESEQTLKQALETIRDNFRNLLYRLTFIIFLEDPNNDEALQEIFADALRRSINEEGKTQIESLLFQLFISCLKSCKQENFQNLNEHQFFERFTLQLKNQADTSTSELTLPALEKCKQDQLFLFCLSKYIEAFYKKNIIAPKIDAARLDCSNLSADFDKIKQELEGLQKADPFDKLEEKSAYLSSNP